MQHNDARFIELLRRWQSGDFTRADEQELNALTASDDFRREAIEGFMSMPEAAHDERLAALRTRLLERTGSKGGGGRFIAMPQILTAAAVLVLVIAAILFFPARNNKDAAPIARTQTQPEEQIAAEQSEPPEGSADGDHSSQKTAPAKPAPSANRPTSSAPGQPALSAPAEVAAADEIDDKQSNYSAAPSRAAAPLPSRPQSESVSAGKIEEVAVSRAKESAKAKKSKELDQQADSVWHETDLKPDMDAERKAARADALPIESEPEGGWKAFSEYLRLNTRLTPDARNHNISGTVRLQFNLNANGDPQAFVVLRSVGYGCDQEAIRLVKNWEWIPGKNSTVTVEVPFVR